jgi:hypothetical protein
MQLVKIPLNKNTNTHLSFCPKDQVIYPGKSDYQTPAPQIISRPGQFFKKQKCKYPDPGNSFQKKKNPLMPGLG